MVTKTKSAKKASSKATKGTATKKAPKPAGTCPKGDGHQWIEQDGEKFCAKCHEPAPAKAKGVKKATKAKKPAKDKKLSAIDAAAKVLAEAKEPMNAKQLIEAMATKGLWTTPGGKTPHATLYSAILREIQVKGKDSRFVKADRGTFKIA